MSLEGKVAVVTGASRGPNVGAALEERGARVARVARTAEPVGESVVDLDDFSKSIGDDHQMPNRVERIFEFAP